MNLTRIPQLAADFWNQTFLNDPQHEKQCTRGVCMLEQCRSPQIEDLEQWAWYFFFIECLTPWDLIWNCAFAGIALVITLGVLQRNDVHRRMLSVGNAPVWEELGAPVHIPLTSLRFPCRCTEFHASKLLCRLRCWRHRVPVAILFSVLGGLPMGRCFVSCLRSART